MITNVIFGLVIPWIAGVYLLKKDVKVFLLMAPFAIVVAYVFDVVGFKLEFWRIDPKNDIETFAALPMYFGVYPILTGYLFYFIKRAPHRTILWLLLITLLTTIIEWIGVTAGMVHYYNGWTIFWTFISYMLAYLVCYGYFTALQRYVDV